MIVFSYGTKKATADVWVRLSYLLIFSSDLVPTHSGHPDFARRSDLFSHAELKLMLPSARSYLRLQSAAALLHEHSHQSGLNSSSLNKGSIQQ